MSRTDAGRGAGPSGRYGTLADQFGPVFAEIRAAAVEPDRERRLRLASEEACPVPRTAFHRLRSAWPNEVPRDDQPAKAVGERPPKRTG